MAAPIKVGRGGAGNFYGEADLKQLRSPSSGKDVDLEAQHPSPSKQPIPDPAPRAPAPEYMRLGRGGAGNWYSPREDSTQQPSSNTNTDTLPSSSTTPSSSTSISAGTTSTHAPPSILRDDNDTEEKRPPHGATGKGGRGGAGNIEFNRLMAEQRDKDDEQGTELKEWKEEAESKVREKVERDVEMGLPPPQKAFLGPGR